MSLILRNTQTTKIQSLKGPTPEANKSQVKGKTFCLVQLIRFK